MEKGKKISLDSIAQRVVNITNASECYPYCFYGIFSRLGLSFSSNGAKLQLRFAKALNPGAPTTGKKKKGEATYDNENQQFFTLSSTECFTVLNNYKKVLDGTYEYKPLKKDENVNEKYKGSIQLKHFGEDNNKTLAFSKHLDKNGNTRGMKTTLVFGKDSISFVLTGAELSLFAKFVEAGAYESHIVFQYINMAITRLKTTMFKESEISESYKNSSKNNNKYKSNNSKETEENNETNDDNSEYDESDTSEDNETSKSEDTDEDNIPW